MLNFVQNLQYYMMCEVLEPNWRLLEEGLHSVSNIDDVLLMHNDFLDKCLRDCMLSSRDVLKTMSRLLAICISFTKHIQIAAMQEDTCQGSEFNVRSCPLSADVESGRSVRDIVNDCECKFTADLVQLLDWLYSVHSEGVGSMVARLDFNGYYKTWYTRTPTSSH